MSNDQVVIQGAARPRAGALRMALAEHGVSAEAVGALRVRGDDLEVTLEGPSARELVTPVLLRLDGVPCVARRASDLPAAVAVWSLRLETRATAGELARALFEVGGVLGEDLLAIRRRGESLEVELPLWRYREADLPRELLGRPVVVEKKKPRSRLSGSLSAAEALRDVLSHGPSAVQLKRVIKRCVDASRGDEALLDAVRRIADRGSPVDAATLPTTDPGLLLCVQALAPRKARQRLHGLYRAVPFPGPAERASSALLDALHAEAGGESPALWPLSQAVCAAADTIGALTVAAGTVLPGRRKAGLGPIAVEGVAPDADRPSSEILDAWLEIAGRLAGGAAWDELEPAVLQLGQRVALAASNAGLDLSGWRALVELVRSESEGEASPRLRPPSALSPSSAAWVLGMTRAIDAAVLEGDAARAAALAEEGATARPDSAELTRRAVRLGRRTDLVTEDPVTLVHAGEALYRRGNASTAARVFEVSGAEPGSRAADHVARRLFLLDRPQAAARFVSETSPLAKREHAAVAREHWAQAAELWALRQGHRLGLTSAPPWADAGVRVVLGAEHKALMDGDLEAAASLGGAAGALVAAVLADPLRLESPTPKAEPIDAASLLQLAIATPDPCVVLHATGGLDDVVGALPLLRLAVREVASSDWDGQTASALAALVRRTQDAELAKTIDTATLLGWLEGPDSEKAAAAEVILSHPTRIEAAAERLDHGASRRVERALALLGEDRLAEATAIAQSVLKKALPGPARSQAAAVLAIAGELEPLAAALAPPRWDGGRMALAFDVLLGIDSTRDDGPLPEHLEPLVRGLHSAPGRLMAVRARLLSPR